MYIASFTVLVNNNKYNNSNIYIVGLPFSFFFFFFDSKNNTKIAFEY